MTALSDADASDADASDVDSGGSGAAEPDDRRPRSVYGVGDEPDPRFSLANERTALAWMRTALALVAAGVGLTSLGAVASLPRFLDVVAAALCLAGGALALRAVRGWRSQELALRLGRPLRAPRSLAWLASLVLVIGAVLAGYALSRVW